MQYLFPLGHDAITLCERTEFCFLPMWLCIVPANFVIWNSFISYFTNMSGQVAPYFCTSTSAISGARSILYCSHAVCNRSCLEFQSHKKPQTMMSQNFFLLKGTKQTSTCSGSCFVYLWGHRQDIPEDKAWDQAERPSF